MGTGRQDRICRFLKEIGFGGFHNLDSIGFHWLAWLHIWDWIHIGSVGFGWIGWNEIPDIGSGIGAIFIISSCLFLTLQGKLPTAWKMK